MCKRTIGVPQELGRALFCSSAKSRLETPGYQLQASAAHSSVEERRQRVQPRYRQAKETKRGGMAAGRRSVLIVPLKQGNSPWRTLWRKAKRRSTDSIEGNMSNTSRFINMSTSLDRIASGTVRTAKLLVRGTGCSNAGTSGSVGAVCLMYRLRVQDEPEGGTPCW